MAVVGEGVECDIDFLVFADVEVAGLAGDEGEA